MQKVLIVIHDMESGGSQKSLLSFLKCISESEEIKNYEIRVMVANPSGIFYSQIPGQIIIADAPKELLWLGTSLRSKLLQKNFSFKGVLGKIKWSLCKKRYKLRECLNEEQMMWKCWNKIIPTNQEKYDIAISYMNGFPNYYVIDKVNAQKKILWIHNEYQKLNYNREYDYPYYNACDKIITISKKCAESFGNVFPCFMYKTTILENITIKKDIVGKANCGSNVEFEQNCELKLLSVGRLCEQKAFEIAVEAAKILNANEYKFVWLIIGEGPKRDCLQAKIDEYHLQDKLKLIGVRENPYSYIKSCDVFVQTSRYEGKSIVLDEAKTFAKPIVVTDYPTVRDSIIHNENGIIVSMDGMSVAKGIMEVITDLKLQQHLVHTLQESCESNEREYSKYIAEMLE